ncbi:MAG: hypothetical protein HY834_02305 [Devosia nanyangense]|uniref:Uncharacterized protein n=1 Tax=Devosia nanyangense TaxID=1228055 RepID=A0A933NWU8_9HYPH|nr:hypothetical protein [Devosia nanyangense]
MSGSSDDRGLVRRFRAGLVVGGPFALAGALAFLLKVDAVVQLWPYQTYGLSHVFIASLLAAIGAPVVWIGASGELASLPGGAGNILVTGGGMGAWAAWQSIGGAPPKVLLFSLVCLLFVVVTAAMIVRARKLEFADSRPTPGLVRWSFILFCVLLLIIGSLLVLRVPGIFPWLLDDNASVSYGFAFLGAAAYFGFGASRPVWGNAKGQLLAFLAYDLVLIGPFVLHFSTVSSQLLLSLSLYVGVLAYSGALAIFFLLLDRRFRLGSGLAAV